MTASFDPTLPGHALSEAGNPSTPKNVPHRGGPANPAGQALQQKFAAAIVRVDVVWGETTVVVARDRVLEVIEWLKNDDEQRCDYCSDITAVEYRDVERAIEVVWHLRSLPFRRFLRIKVMLEKGTELSVPSVVSLYAGANWLERECYDMFGIKFDGHPDLRRILMWESYKEGFPLRKDFPLRGRFSRSEQLRQALSANPEARYSMEELSIADAFEDLPKDMRKRIDTGLKTGE